MLYYVILCYIILYSHTVYVIPFSLLNWNSYVYGKVFTMEYPQHRMSRQYVMLALTRLSAKLLIVLIQNTDSLSCNYVV